MDFEIKSWALSSALNGIENINELSEDEINGIEELRLITKKEILEKRGDTTFEQETSEVLHYLQELRRLFIKNASKDYRLSINLYSGVAEKLEIIHLNGIDLSKADLKKFFREHKNLSNIRLTNCNISDLSFLDYLPEELHTISLTNNPIPSKYADYILRLRQERFRSLDISECNEILEEFGKYDCELSSFLTNTTGKLNGKQFYEAFQKALYSRKFTINDMKQLSQYIDFSSEERLNEEREVYIDDIDNISEEYIENINTFTKGKNTTLVLTPKQAQMLKGSVSNDIKVQLLIRNASELSVEQLDELDKVFSLSSVKIDDSEQSLSEQQKVPYDIDTYRKCRSKIDELIQGIDLNIDQPDRDKKIFGEVINRLANHMSYDYASLKKEDAEEQDYLQDIYRQYDKERPKSVSKHFFALAKLGEYREKRVSKTSVVCRNMEGGLLNNTCVCAGYAEIVRNVFACCGIDSKYVSGQNKKPMAAGHAWNQIKLDGQWYNLDLTWDRDSIVDGKSTQYTLQSDNEFDHTEYDSSNSKKNKCDSTLDTVELEKYIYGKDRSIENGELKKNNKKNNMIFYLPSGKEWQLKIGERASLYTQHKKTGLLKEIERTLTETDIKGCYGLLAQTKSKREQKSINLKREGDYDNR